MQKRNDAVFTKDHMQKVVTSAKFPDAAVRERWELPACTEAAFVHSSIPSSNGSWNDW